MLLSVPYSFVLSNSSETDEVPDQGGLRLLLELEEMILVEGVQLLVLVVVEDLMVRTPLVLVVL